MLTTQSTTEDSQVTSLKCRLRSKGGETRRMEVVLYGPSGEGALGVPGTQRFIIQCKTHVDQGSSESDSSIIQVPRRGPSSSQEDREVFTELAPTRATSWQYELQQLKFANRKLRRAVATLESNLCSTPTTMSTSSSGPSLILHLDESVEVPAESAES